MKLHRLFKKIEKGKEKKESYSYSYRFLFMVHHFERLIEKNNGKLLMIVREPVQTLDSQFTLHSNNF